MSSKWVLVSHGYQGAREALEAGFRGAGYHVAGVCWPHEAGPVLAQFGPPTLAVVELRPDALELVALLCRTQPGVSVALVTGKTDSGLVHPALQLGAGAVLASPTTARAVLDALDIETLHQLESRLIDEALARCGGNKAAAARLLGIDPTSLRRKLYKKAPPRGSR